MYRAKQKFSTFRILLAAVLIIGAIFSVRAVPTFAASLPCDIYAAGGTPCVAAHSTTRALFSAYSGKLYQVKRASDNTTTDISTLSAGGYANGPAQDSFCSGTTCTITIIYDQTANHNDLPIEGAGAAGVADHGANATEMKVSAGGHTVYGMWSDGQTAYRNNAPKGTATGSQPQGQYSVFSGTHYNNLCCFDYGNTEVTNSDTGNGHMDAIYFGSATWFQPLGAGPAWVGADLENGMFFGANGCNPQNTGINATFVTAMTKSDGTTTYAIRGGNANSGGLTTWYNGSLPTQGGYIPLHQEGGIVLGSGGDNSNGDTGAWLEGAMTSGTPSDATEASVQANIVSVGYGIISAPAATATPPVSPSATPGTLGGLVKLNAGGGAVGSFSGDADYDFGNGSGTSATIDTSAANAAPMQVYQSERWFGCTMTYTIPGLTANAPYNVRLHFAETFFTSAGQRVFNVAINGTQVLTDFDIFATAGAANKAVVKQFATNANGSGQIAIAFLVGKANNPKVNGIEILTGSGPTATPTFVPTTTPSTEAPYGGTRPNLPGTVQIENYDTGGQNVGYSKPSAGTSTTNYRTDSAAQIETAGDTGGGFDVGWTNTNDWYKYMVNVTSAGTYTFDVRAASPNTGSAYHMEVDGTNVTGSMTVPNTGNWQTYTDVNKTGISLSAGQHTLRLVVDNGGMNFNWFSVTSAGGATNTPTFVPVTNTPTQHTGVVSINAGGSAAGSFIADADFSGGTLYSNTNTIDTSGVTNPAPAAVYQTERWGAMTYTIPNLTPNSTYTVRLHFAELYWTAVGQRKFNVAINGTNVLTNFDIIAAAGAANKAIVEQFSATANASGQIVIAFSVGSADNPKISGIEVQ